jgi:hypothetical protein
MLIENIILGLSYGQSPTFQFNSRTRNNVIFDPVNHQLVMKEAKQLQKVTVSFKTYPKQFGTSFWLFIVVKSGVLTHE